jgi:hypothetical protein
VQKFKSFRQAIEAAIGKAAVILRAVAQTGDCAQCFIKTYDVWIKREFRDYRIEQQRE